MSPILVPASTALSIASLSSLLLPDTDFEKACIAVPNFLTLPTKSPMSM